MKKDKKEKMEKLEKLETPNKEENIEQSAQELPPTKPEEVDSSTPTPPLSVGTMLRSKREELNIDISLVEGMLKIPTHNLKKIENDRLDQLPSQLFAKGYIKSYANFLGIPEKDILEAYATQVVDTLPKIVNHKSATTYNKKIDIPLEIKSEEPKKNAILYVFIVLGLFFTTIAVLLITMKDRISSSSQYVNIKDDSKVDFEVSTETPPEPILENSPTKIADPYEVFLNAMSVDLQASTLGNSWISIKDNKDTIIFEDNIAENSEKIFEIPKNKFPLTIVIGRGDDLSIRIDDLPYDLPKARLVSNTIRMQLTLDMVGEFLKSNATTQAN